MTIEYSAEAEDDLSDIFEYVSNVSGMPETAERIVNSIRKRVYDLEVFPKRYRFWHETEYRFFTVKNYIVFYRYDEQNDRITIVRVIHSHRDIDLLL